MFRTTLSFSAVGSCICGLLVVVALVNALPATAANADDNAGGKTTLDILSGYDDADPKPNDKICDKEFYSAACDKWVRAYVNNDLVTAQSTWSLILSDLKNCNTIEPFVDQLYDRIRFASPDDATNNSRFGLIPFYKNLVAFTQKSVGTQHRFMLDAIEPLAWDMEEAKDYKAAFDWRKKALPLLEKIQPPRPFQLASSLGESARDLCRLKQYQDAEVLLKRAINIADAHHFKRQVADYVQLYASLLDATNRKSERNRLLAQYQTVLRQPK